MALQHRTLGESLGQDASQSPVIFLTGKGGVGKSMVSAALAHGLEQRGRSIVLADLDGEPSSTDALGGTEAQRENLMVRNEILQLRERLSIILLGNLIPEIDEEHLEDSDAFAAALNHYLNAILRDEVEGQPTFLPIMRLAMQSLFYGIPTEAKDLAHILQLMEITQRQRHFAIDNSSPSNLFSLNPVPVHHHLIIDTENTNNLLRMLRYLKRLGRSMQNVHKRVHEGGLLGKANATNIAFRHTPNLSTYADSSVGRNPDTFVDASERMRHLFFSERAKLVIVTNPGPTEIRKAISDLKHASQARKTVAHILMNRWPTDPALQEGAERIEAQFIATADRMNVVAGYTRITPGMLEQASPYDERYAQRQTMIVEKITETLGLEHMCP